MVTDRFLKIDSLLLQHYDGENEEKTNAFWEEVRRLSRIRHENITLFMGACVESDHLALVTG